METKRTYKNDKSWRMLCNRAKHECGDCFYILAADNSGSCHCELSGLPVTPMEAACQSFKELDAEAW